MSIQRRKLIVAPVAGALVALGASPRKARAQVMSKAARLIVPWPPGGSTDSAARLLAEQMLGKYAPAIVIDNKPGAGGRLGLDVAKAAEADGSVFVLSPASPFVMYPHVYKKLSYDPFVDLVPVTRVCKFSFALSVGPMVPASVKTVADFLQWCRANPKDALYGIAAAGSGTHFAGVMLSRASGVTLTSVPYKGGAPAVQDLMGGQVAATLNVLGEVLPFVGSGKLRILATTGEARSRLTPDVPAVAETFPGYVAAEWSGVFVPRRTPPGGRRQSRTLAVAPMIEPATGHR